MRDKREHETLGSWIRRRRKALDLTQAAVAHCVGCAEVTIRRLEAEVHRPSRQLTERLATCLEIPADEHAVFVRLVRGEHRAERLASALLPSDPVPYPSAQVSVERLPLDRVPHPAPLPTGSRMPLRRNPLFVGRDEDLRQVVEALTADGAAAIGQLEIAVATGLGGIGKTQLACEFVHRYGQFFPGGVFWLSFADPAAIPAEVAACGGTDAMHLRPEFDMLPLDEQVKFVLAAWASATPRLLVFDTCEDEALLHQWRPTHGGCRVLLTSRRHHWDPALGVQPIPLDVLPRADSVALLRTFRPDLPSDDPDLAAIAAMLGDLPLALHLAGSFLAKYRHALTPKQYRARLHVPTILDDRSLQAAGLSPTKHVQHVARTFEQSYAQLDPADPTDALARTLLAHAACCAPGEPVPRSLLMDTLERPNDTESPFQSEDAFTRLIDLGLLEPDAAGSLRLHRLVLAFVRTVLVDAAAQTTVESAILRVTEALNEQRNPHPLLAVQPHLRFLTEAALSQADARAASLCTALGVHLFQLGVYVEAERYHAQALSIRRRVLGAEHPDTALSLNNMGNVLWKQGQYDRAERYHAQALSIRRRVLGAEHPDTAKSLANLGVILEAQGQYVAAERALEQALAIWQRLLGNDHPITALSLINLGGVIEAQGQYAEAQHTYEQALAIQERVLGNDHPDTALSHFSLGEVFTAQGQYVEAQRSLEQALTIYRRALGDDHPHTVRGLRALGEILQAQGQYAEAQRSLEQALAIRQRVLGEDHPHTAESFHTLGVVFTAQGQYAEAQRSLEQALAIRQRVLGDDHPDTARSLRSVGEVLHVHGERTRARRYVEQALAIFTQRLGSQHPDTKQTRQLLADLAANPTSVERGG
ncbi:MAG TPA: tetratricopeptide repeat protein [Herpetosiphonaceae bacterium]